MRNGRSGGFIARFVPSLSYRRGYSSVAVEGFCRIREIGFQSALGLTPLCFGMRQIVARQGLRPFQPSPALSATIGSTLAARRAGSDAATSDTTLMPATTAA